MKFIIFVDICPTEKKNGCENPRKDVKICVSCV